MKSYENKFRGLTRLCILILPLLMLPLRTIAEDGYELWLRYHQVEDPDQLEAYRSQIKYAVMDVTAPEQEAARQELARGIKGLLGKVPDFRTSLEEHGAVVAGTPESCAVLNSTGFITRAETLGPEGYAVFTTTIESTECIVILAREPVGVLYGTFHLLRLIQTGQDLQSIDITEIPKVEHRILNHWDNLDRTVERGYAGFSIWDWHRLPGHTSQQYIDYARANASIGINGTVLTNVNANANILTERYLKKVASLADAFRPYGIRVYLTARFSAPVELDGYPTADPLDTAVIAWWKQKAREIYRLIPDFGGFLVKANSEGQPGPQDYNRSHADGANMLADAVGPFGGIVMWRAFVYDNNVPDDRAKQAYNEFVPLDGQFRDNVIIQVKNGPIDFQPREPFHPLFGAMPGTPLGMEFQITQEYLGQGTDLVYLAPLYKECLDSDTRVKGKNSTVARIIDGSLHGLETSCVAGVANIGTDKSWCGHQFAQSNWYAFGRLAWDHSLSADRIADEWLRMTFTHDAEFISSIKNMMLRSREICVNYMTPLGLHHIMARGHHYGPGPWVSGGRADWTSVYYHRADSAGIGFDRTEAGSNALEQYHPEVIELYSDPASCPDELLLWFHHLPWDYRMRSGRTLWEDLCHAYYSGSDSVSWMQEVWNARKGKIDPERFKHVSDFLAIQKEHALLWRNACTLYFQSHSGLPVPECLEKPQGSLEEYMQPTYPYAPPRFRRRR